MGKGYLRERESISPCVVLVLYLKKDGMWRMGIDCWEIKNITKVKYRHPILILAHTLDELHE